MFRCMGCMEQSQVLARFCPFCGYDNESGPKEGYQLSPGSILGDRYIVGRVLGAGGFGVTYIGFDASLERKVAIKEFLPSMYATRIPGSQEISVYSQEHTQAFQQGLERFIEEVGRVAAFHQVDGVVDVYDSVEENNTAYMVMEYLEGQDVKQVIKESGPMDWQTVQAVAVSICDILEPVHQLGVIHRDISPDNIFLTRDGAFKLIDFGAARYETSKNSKSLSVILKSGYAPEEQYRSHGVQGAYTDVYALAATCYKMLTGYTPPDSMERAVKDELIPPSKLVAGIPPSMENAILNALAVRAEDRTKTAALFRQDLLAEQTERNEIKERKKEHTGLSTGMKIFLTVALCVTCFLAFMAASGKLGGAVNLLSDQFGSGLSEGYVNTPGIVNLSQDQAKQELSKAGLTYLVAGKEYSDKIEKDKVLSQTPLPGRAVEAGSVVEVVICGGVADQEVFTGEIPDVVYESYAGARKKMEQAGVEAQYLFVYDDAVKSGLVISQENLENGQTTVYVSLGSATLTEDQSRHTVPLLDLRIERDVLLLDFVFPIQDNHSVTVDFEYDEGYGNWKTIPGFTTYDAYGYFSQVPADLPQPMETTDILMSLARDRQLPQSTTLVVRAYVSADTQPFEMMPSQSVGFVRIEKSNSLYPSVTVERVEELSMEQVEPKLLTDSYGDLDGETYYPYLMIGDFKKDMGYYLYDGTAAWDMGRQVNCYTDGQLMVISNQPLDGSKTLASVMPLYGTTYESDSTIVMKVGSPTVVDSQYYVLSKPLEQVEGRTVFDAIRNMEDQAGAYRYQLPYRFRFVCDDQVPRGHVISYTIEQDPQNKEVYRLDLVVSNGKAGQTFEDLVVPVQWIPPKRDGSGTYSQLVYFTLPPDSLPPDTRYTYHLQRVGLEGEVYWGEEEMDHLNAILRGDGSGDGDFYPPEGYFPVEEWAEIMAAKGMMNMGDELYIQIMPAIPYSDVMTGQTLELAVPLVSQLKKP